MTKQTRNLLASSCVLVLTLALASVSKAQEVTETPQHPLMEFAGTEDPPLFNTPDEAVAAFKKAAGGDVSDLASLLGLDATRIKDSEEATATYQEIRAGVQEKVLVKDVQGFKVLEIGNRLWPLPFPLAQESDGKWYFDTFKGLEEIANRNVGGNELLTLTTMRAYVEVQEEYASEDRDGDGVLEYAQKLISSEGKQDGLYWPTGQEGAVESPVGENIVAADEEAGDGYFGYRYRILTKQGDNIVGGEFDYVINGNMIAGFALVAWPVEYGVSGVNTFVVSRDGIVYEADLGEKTTDTASAIRTFNPNDDWNVVID